MWMESRSSFDEQIETRMADPSIQLGLVKRALIDDRSNLVVALVGRLDDDGVLTLQPIPGDPTSVTVSDPEGVKEALRDRDGTFHNGSRLAFVNENYRLLGLAFGPAKADSPPVIIAVLDLEDRYIPSHDEHPGWRPFRLQPKD